MCIKHRSSSSIPPLTTDHTSKKSHLHHHPYSFLLNSTSIVISTFLPISRIVLYTFLSQLLSIAIARSRTTFIILISPLNQTQYPSIQTKPNHTHPTPPPIHIFLNIQLNPPKKKDGNSPYLPFHLPPLPLPLPHPYKEKKSEQAISRPLSLFILFPPLSASLDFCFRLLKRLLDSLDEVTCKVNKGR